MGRLWAGVDRVTKMFVTDWAQTAITIALLILVGVAIHRWRQPGLGFGLAALLTGQLFYSTWTEASRRRAP